MNQKKTFTYAEKSEEKREKYLKDLAKIPEEKRVYVDESGVNQCFVREFGRAFRGEKVEDVKRGRHFQRTNVVAGRLGTRIVAPFCYVENMTGPLFTEWFRKILVKSVPKGSTVIMDNASFHLKPKLKNLARRHGIRLLFLPPYSPDFNPIEKTWASMKRALADLLPQVKNLENAILFWLKNRNC